MTTTFKVHEVAGRFVVRNEREILAVMESRDAAEFACAQLNYEPGRNACDVFMQGRWATPTRKEEAA